MTRMRVRSPIAGVLLAALAITGGPAAELRAELPADLSLVPRNSVGFVTVRIADLAQSKPGQQFLTALRREISDVSTGLEKELGLPLADVERVTVVAGSVGDEGVVIIVRTLRPYDRARLVRTLMPEAREVKKGAKAIYLDPRSQKGLYCADDQVFARGPMQALASLAVGEGGQGPLADAVTRAAERHQIVAGIQPGLLVAAWLMPAEIPARPKATGVSKPDRAVESAVPIQKPPAPPSEAPGADEQNVSRPGPIEQPPAAAGEAGPSLEQLLSHLPPEALPFKPLLQARSATLVVDVGDDIKASVFLNYADAEQTKDGETALKITLYVARELCAYVLRETNLEPEMAAKLNNLVKRGQTALKGATIQVRGTVVEAAVRLEAEPALVAEVVMLLRRSAQGTTNANNLKQLAIAMLNFESAYAMYPPAAICDKTGKPLLSWRVLILPYIEQDALYNEFHLNEAWDSPHNKKLLERMPKIYAPVQGKTKEPYTTYYQVFTGPLTIFPFQPNPAAPYGARGSRIADITDGTSNTLLVAEAAEAVPWTKPEDMPFDMTWEEMSKNVKKPVPKLGGQFPGGFYAVAADGAVHFIKKPIDDDMLRWLIMKADGNVIDWEGIEGRQRGPAPASTAPGGGAAESRVKPGEGAPIK